MGCEKYLEHDEVEDRHWEGGWGSFYFIGLVDVSIRFRGVKVRWGVFFELGICICSMKREREGEGRNYVERVIVFDTDLRITDTGARDEAARELRFGDAKKGCSDMRSTGSSSC